MTSRFTTDAFSRRHFMLGSAALIAAGRLPAQTTGTGGFAGRDDVRAFCAELADAHGFDAGWLLTQFEPVQPQPRVIELIRPPTKPGVRSWQRYRGRFVEPLRIREGRAFMDEYVTTLARAEQQYGVPPHVVTAIIGVETIYGRHTGNFPVIGALATLAFDYPPRAELFRRELGELFLLARDQNRDVASYRGSYAGALGYPQFLPSSWRRYAVDFDNDGRVDLIDSPIDAIGSVAAYLKEHGWEPGEPVVQRILVDSSTVAPLIESGIEPLLDTDRLLASGIRPLGRELISKPAAVVDLITPDAPTEYWLGFRNFYVITRYNKSSFYAMAVHQLSEALARG
ncbi:MAG: lytic murein transglycosylase B [Pseudomonadota bacterium]